MPFNWQYQRLAEPVFPPSAGTETVTVDKWYRLTETPLRTSAFVAAVFATSLFFVPQVTQAETVTVDKWYAPIVQPQFKAGTAHLSQPFANECFCAAVSLEQSKYAWRPSYPDQHLSVKNTNQLYPTWVDSEFPDALKLEQSKYAWRPDYPNVLNRDVDRRYSYPFVFDAFLSHVPGSEVITVDKWFAQASEPVRVAPPLRIQGYTEPPSQTALQREISTRGGWRPDFPDLIFPVKNIDWIYPSLFEAPEGTQIQIAKFQWRPDIIQNIPPLPRAIDFTPGAFVRLVVVTPVVNLDKWMGFESFPRWIAFRPDQVPYSSSLVEFSTPSVNPITKTRRVNMGFAQEKVINLSFAQRRVMNTGE